MSERPCSWCDPWTKRPPGVYQMWARVFVCRECAVKKGGLLGRRVVMIADLGGDFSPANLKRLADAGIMDANALFLPAGKLSKADADARDWANILDE